MPVKPLIIRKARPRAIMPLIYGTGFLFYFHSYLSIYVNSTFIERFAGEKLVGLLYVIGSLLAVAGLVFLPKALRAYGNYKVTLILSVLQIIATLALAVFGVGILIILNFIIFITLIPLLSYNLDLVLENYSTDVETGGIRGTFLTLTNIALVASPFIVGVILGTEESYSRLYVAVAFILIIFTLVFRNKFKNYKDPVYETVSTVTTLKKVWKSLNLRNILLANVVLRFFYAWMVIYTPIYLHEHIGMSWSEIGIVFTIMLIPFATIELPLGKIADKFFGEKEILTAGFIIMFFSTAALSFITTQTVIVWAILLFLTRVGASAVEIMSETYFFKKIGSEDSAMLSVYRMVYPASSVVAPILASFLLFFIDFRWLFLVLGFICLYGIRHSLAIKDTL
jgi:MFS family permease